MNRDRQIPGEQSRGKRRHTDRVAVAAVVGEVGNTAKGKRGVIERDGIAQGTDDIAGMRQGVLGALGQAEVSDPNDPRQVQQEVTGLDVAMNNAALVRVVQPKGDLKSDLGNSRRPALRVGLKRDPVAKRWIPPRRTSFSTRSIAIMAGSNSRMSSARCG